MSCEKLSDAQRLEFPDEWYADNQDSHFWFAWRYRVFQRILAGLRLPMTHPLRALDIGCGVGLLRKQIEDASNWTVDGADVNESALAQALPGRGATFLYDIEERAERFKAAYDVLILFDVVEHISEIGPFLRAASWHLKAGGFAFINVPALGVLYSQYDRLVGHVCRYDRRSMRALLTRHVSELAIVDMRYWGLTLVPLIGLRKALLRGAGSPREAVARGFHPPAPWTNTILRALMRVETTLITHPPLGSSLMVAARRNLSAPGDP